MIGVTRAHVEPRDVPREAAARRLGLSLGEFDTCFDNLIARGFPEPDPDTKNFDLNAIDRWCDARNPHLFGATTLLRKQRRNAGRKPKFDQLINDVLVELFEWHGNLRDYDPEWRTQADVEKAVREKLSEKSGDNCPASSTIRMYVSKFLANRSKVEPESR